MTGRTHANHFAKHGLQFGFWRCVEVVMRQEVARSRACWNMRRKTRLPAMEDVINNSVGAERPPWAMATMVCLQSYIMFSISEA